MIHDAPGPPLATITDQRPILRGVIPRSAKTWLVGGGALALAVVVIVFGGPRDVAKSATAAMVPAATPADPERLQHYEQQLRQAPVATPVSPATGTLTTAGYEVPPAPSPYVDVTPRPLPAPAPPPDPITEDRRRRDYESLFSSNVVISRRAGGDALSTAPGAAPAEAPPSLDETTRSVMRAMGVPQATQPAPSAATARTPAAAGETTYRIDEGTVINAVLANRLDGSGIAPVNALVTDDVWSTDHRAKLIPAGVRVLGTASAVQGFGQSRLGVAFHRIVGNGLDISLDQFVGMNIRGDAGLKDQVNAHYLSIFGAAAAVGLIGGLSQAVGGMASRDNTTVVVGGAGDATAQAAGQTMQRFVNQMPTVTIREGHRLLVYVTSDLHLPAYHEVSNAN
jgi:type IV secretion system protein VirB10